MQKLIAKYALAAHLAILAVAPLFLSAFCTQDAIARVLLWLSAFSAAWIFMEPSIFRCERPHESRIRVAKAVFTDPVFWASFALAGLCAFRWLNDGVSMAYDAESGEWFISKAAMELMPGSVENSGFLPFAATVALMVILQGCRHAMGKAARMAFLLASSGFAGIAAVTMIVAMLDGHAGAVGQMMISLSEPSYPGVAFAVHFLGGAAAMAGAFERKWNRAIILAFPALGGTAAGLFVFAPSYVSAVFAAAAVLVIGYSFAYMGRTMRKAAEFKYLVVLGLSLTLGTLLVMSAMPEDMLSSRIAPFLSGEFLADRLMKPREILSAIAFKVWSSNLWTGSGVGSFPIDISFNALEEDWYVIGNSQKMALNGFWQLLAERGIIGAVLFSVMLGFLSFTYARRAAGAFKAWQMPHPACFVAPLATTAVALTALFDASFMRADLILVCGAAWAISAGSFPKEKTDGR